MSDVTSETTNSFVPGTRSTAPRSADKGGMARTLPAPFYTDPKHFQREMETFFFSQWVCVGRADQIPETGNFFLRDVAGESLIVVRDEAGKVNAFYNVCRHRGTRLCEKES